MIRPVVRKCQGTQCLFNCDGKWCDAEERDLDEYGNCWTFIDKDVYKGPEESND